MEIDFNHKFTHLDGTIIPEGPDTVEEIDGKNVPKKSPPLTLRTTCVNVLLGRRLKQIKCPKCGNDLNELEMLSGEEINRRYILVRKIYSSTGLVDIGKKDIELLKKLIAFVYPSTLMVGQAWAILDPTAD